MVVIPQLDDLHDGPAGLDDVAMREDHAFGHAGRPARVDDGQDVLRTHGTEALGESIDIIVSRLGHDLGQCTEALCLALKKDHDTLRLPVLQ